MTHVGDVRVVISRFRGLSVLDASGAELLTRMIDGFRKRGIAELVNGMSSEHRRTFTSVSHEDVIDCHYFDDLPAAITHARTHVHRSVVSDHDANL